MLRFRVNVCLLMIGAESKQRWTSLRAQHRKYLQKTQTRSGQGASTAKKWKYADLLSFLTTFMRDKSRLTSVDDVDEEATEDAHRQTEDEFEGDEISVVASSSRSTASHQRTQRRKKEPQTAAATAMKYILEQKSASNVQKQDALDLFFLTMANTVKTFTAYDQHIVKNKIFELVSQMEARYLMPHPDPAPRYIPNLPIAQQNFHITQLDSGSSTLNTNYSESFPSPNPSTWSNTSWSSSQN